MKNKWSQRCRRTQSIQMKKGRQTNKSIILFLIAFGFQMHLHEFNELIFEYHYFLCENDNASVNFNVVKRRLLCKIRCAKIRAIFARKEPLHLQILQTTRIRMIDYAIDKWMHFLVNWWNHHILAYTFAIIFMQLLCYFMFFDAKLTIWYFIILAGEIDFLW